MSNNKNQNNGRQNRPNPAQQYVRDSVRANALPEGANAAAVNMPPLALYGGNPKKVVYEYDITTRAIEETIKDLFAGIDTRVAENLSVFSTKVSEKFHTVTVMFDPNTVRIGNNKKDNRGENNYLMELYNNTQRTGSKKIQLRPDVRDLLSLFAYTATDREGMRKATQLQHTLEMSRGNMNKFLSETVPFETKVMNRKMIMMHLDPLRVLHYMLRDTRTEETSRDNGFTVNIMKVKYPSKAEAVFTVQRESSRRRRSNGNFDSAMKERAAESLNRNFHSGF